MENPIYVLRTNESAWEPTQNAKQAAFAKKAVRIILVVLLLSSFVLGDNLFGELSLMPEYSAAVEHPWPGALYSGVAGN